MLVALLLLPLILFIPEHRGCNQVWRKHFFFLFIKDVETTDTPDVINLPKDHCVVGVVGVIFDLDSEFQSCPFAGILALARPSFGSVKRSRGDWLCGDGPTEKRSIRKRVSKRGFYKNSHVSREKLNKRQRMLSFFLKRVLVVVKCNRCRTNLRKYIPSYVEFGTLRFKFIPSNEDSQYCLARGSSLSFFEPATPNNNHVMRSAAYYGPLPITRRPILPPYHHPHHRRCRMHAPSPPRAPKLRLTCKKWMILLGEFVHKCRAIHFCLISISPSISSHLSTI